MGFAEAARTCYDWVCLILDDGMCELEPEFLAMAASGVLLQFVI